MDGKKFKHLTDKLNSMKEVVIMLDGKEKTLEIIEIRESQKLVMLYAKEGEFSTEQPNGEHYDVHQYTRRKEDKERIERSK